MHLLITMYCMDNNCSKPLDLWKQNSKMPLCKLFPSLCSVTVYHHLLLYPPLFSSPLCLCFLSQQLMLLLVPMPGDPKAVPPSLRSPPPLSAPPLLLPLSPSLPPDNPKPTSPPLPNQALLLPGRPACPLPLRQVQHRPRIIHLMLRQGNHSMFLTSTKLRLNFYLAADEITIDMRI